MAMKNRRSESSILSEARIRAAVKSHAGGLTALQIEFIGPEIETVNSPVAGVGVGLPCLSLFAKFENHEPGDGQSPAMNVDQKFNTRQVAILGQVRQRGRIFVDELAALYATTPQTIRKDLQLLADAHEVMRFHGGASLLAGIEYTGFETRRNIAAVEKDLIGQAVANRIPNNVALMINIGTTTAAVARHLKVHVGLKVVTDNVNIANELRTYPGVEVLVPGGVVRRSDGAILGEAAVDFIRQFRADIAVIGAAAVAKDGALLDYDLREAHVARSIIENAHHVIMAADGSKFGRSAPVCVGHLSQVHTLVTDRCDNEAIAALCAKHQIDLVEARR